MPAFLSRPLPVAILLAFAAQALFSYGLGTPAILVFDEIHYVPAARAILALSHPVNTEHPLLGKTLIAAGMALFGDNPVGWRALSTVAGTATVLGVYAILLRLFASVRTAAFGALFALFNFTIFVHARIAMLDGFMAAFVVLAVAAMLQATRSRPRLWWTVSSTLLGLAVGVKWAAAPYVAYAGAAFLLLKWRRPDLWPGLSIVGGLAILGVVSIATYFLTFAPAFFYAARPLTLATLIPFQLEMYQLQTQVLSPHTYQSQWWSWPLLLRPIWYLYEPVDGAQRGILLVGNPAVMWGGLIAVAACAWAFLRDRDWKLGGAAALWIGSYGVWAIIPKSLGFFYYYYLPSIFLSIALAAAAHRYMRGKLESWDESFLALAAGLFLYFYPILSADALPNPGAFRRWTWFETWV
ncbi:glycosyltransferase family 39 protein [Sphingomonas lenta]|uniref:Polyprenol-phosphate-mannose--protein mannosyltransferase n=1 Tax=Sphingomonas lenta TaxID=1141887 RepID=A0A2A2SJG5_9SPHN|nr:phospholipid carrier-dependent glycosyltransferase [Sphingomonas lenta]PAX09417.1 dolichyl-phosphate-mannose--protein mannosyltransferase [Sphingomonas lenta]